MRQVPHEQAAHGEVRPLAERGLHVSRRLPWHERVAHEQERHGRPQRAPHGTLHRLPRRAQHHARRGARLPRPESQPRHHVPEVSPGRARIVPSRMALALRAVLAEGADRLLGHGLLRHLHTVRNRRPRAPDPPAPVACRGEPMSDYLQRFSLRQRVEHVLVMSIFTLLALTGFPQKFYDAGWSHAIVGLFGGVERMRFVHRMCGIAFALLSVVHVLTVSLKVAAGLARPSLVPGRKDFSDAVLTIRYYLGLSDHHAEFDRFDYRQKFEYWGLLLGGMLMVVTGLILYFPLITVRFLPGEFVPAAKVAHSNEGLMAFLVVITWHVYNAHLSPDTFPFYTSIFTGKISRERMEHEHPLELARMEGTGTREDTKVAEGVRPRAEDERT